jgi:hypothetical protein
MTRLTRRSHAAWAVLFGFELAGVMATSTLELDRGRLVIAVAVSIGMAI